MQDGPEITLSDRDESEDDDEASVAVIIVMCEIHPLAVDACSST